MKITAWMLLFLFTALTALAQTNSVPALPGATDVNPDIELSKLLLAVIVPLIVAGIKAITPKLPGALIPPLAIALGALSDYIGAKLGLWHGSFLLGLLLGAAGVGIREAATQLKQVVLPK